jgi:hypothetical protein
MHDDTVSDPPDMDAIPINIQNVPFCLFLASNTQAGDHLLSRVQSFIFFILKATFHIITHSITIDFLPTKDNSKTFQ